MFICKDCNDELPSNEKIDNDWFMFGPVSYGPCELCGYNKICMDV